jgi:hypothetical protein
MRRGTKPGDGEIGAAFKCSAITRSEKFAPRDSIDACRTANTTGTNETRAAHVGCRKEACTEGIVLQQSWPC